MSEHEFEHYLTLLARLLPTEPRGQREIGDELRAHLEDRLDDLLGQGIAKPDAIRQAIEELGDAAQLAAAFALLSRRERRRWIMRLSTATLTVAILLTITLLAFWPAGPNQPPLMMAQAQAQAQPGMEPAPPVSRRIRDEVARSVIAKKLDERIDVEFQEIPLADVLEWLEDQIDVQIHVGDQSETTEEALTAPVSVQLKGVQARSVLRLVLRTASEQNQAGLDFIEQDGYVLVAPTPVLDGITEVRVYNCRDLFALHYRNPIPGKSSMRAPKGSLAAGMDAMDSGMGMPTYSAPIHVKPPGDQLGELIESAVDSEAWEMNGGKGTISEFNGLLVIKQSPRVHEKVEELLDMLRDAAEPDQPPQ